MFPGVGEARALPACSSREPGDREWLSGTVAVSDPPVAQERGVGSLQREVLEGLQQLVWELAAPRGLVSCPLVLPPAGLGPDMSPQPPTSRKHLASPSALYLGSPLGSSHPWAALPGGSNTRGSQAEATCTARDLAPGRGPRQGAPKLAGGSHCLTPYAKPGLAHPGTEGLLCQC